MSGTIKRGRLINKTIKEDSNGVQTYGQVKQDSNNDYYYVDKSISRDVNVNDDVDFLLEEASSTKYAVIVTNSI